MRKPNVVVVGSGVAGLVAARALASSGLTVTVLEQAGRPGGRIAAKTLLGVPVELGAEAFATRSGTVARLVRDLGLGDDIVEPASLRAWAVSSDASYQLPAAAEFGIPAQPIDSHVFRAVGLRAMLRLVAEPWCPRAHVPTNATVGEVVRERFGQRVYDRLVAPVTRGVYSISPDALPLSAAPDLAAELNRTGSLLRAARAVRASRRAAGGAVQGIVGGMSRLVGALVGELDRLGATIHTHARAHAIDSREGRWVVRWHDSLGAEDSTCCDAVVLATPADESYRLAGLNLSAANGTAVETVALIIDDARLGRASRGTGALTSHPDIAAKALTHASVKWGWIGRSLPEGNNLVRLSYGSSGKLPATSFLSDDAAATLALRDAGAVFGMQFAPSQLVGHARARWTIPVKHTGEPLELPQNFLVTGESFAGTGLANVIKHAEATAATVIASLYPHPHQSSRQ